MVLRFFSVGKNLQFRGIVWFIMQLWHNCTLDRPNPHLHFSLPFFLFIQSSLEFGWELRNVAYTHLQRFTSLSLAFSGPFHAVSRWGTFYSSCALEKSDRLEFWGQIRIHLFIVVLCCCWMTSIHLNCLTGLLLLTACPLYDITWLAETFSVHFELNILGFFAEQMTPSS